MNSTFANMSGGLARSKFSLATKIMLLVCIPVFIQFGLIAYLSAMQNEAELQAARAEHAKQINQVVNGLIHDLAEIASITSIGEVSSGQIVDVKGVIASVKHIMQTFNELEQLTGNDPAQLQVVRSSKAATQRTALIYKQIIRVNLAGGDVGKTQRKALWHELRAALKQTLSQDLITLNKDQERIGEEAERKQAEARHRSRELLSIAAGVNIISAILIAIFLVSSIKKRLKVMADNTLRLAAGQPLLPIVKGADEIALLDATFHTMAKRLAEAARKERAVIENAVDMICSIDKSLRFFSVNPASKAILNCSSEEIVGHRVRDFIADQDWPAAAEAFASVEKREKIDALELRVKQRGGEQIHTSWSMRYSDVEDSIFCVIHDVSERKRAEELRQELVAMITHDLRTPLSSVGNVLEMLGWGKLGELSEKGSSMVQLAARNASQMGYLIDDLLDLEKARAGMMTLALDQVDLKEVFEETGDLIQPLAAKRNITVKIEDPDLIVKADSERVTRVLVNLVGNALKYSTAGSSVYLTAKQDNGMAQISVRDEGPGIPAQKRERLFERYFQTATEHGRLGSGLGLSICKVLVELHGGTIWINSELDKGTEFIFTLPMGGAVPAENLPATR